MSGMDFFKGVYYGVLQLDGNSICFALLLLIIVICLVRAMFNLAMFTILACIIMVAWMNYSPQDIYYKAQSVMKETRDFARKTIEPILAENLQNADVHHFKDGTYEILVSNVRAVGKKGEDKITIYYGGEKLVLNRSDFGKNVETLLKDIGDSAEVMSNTTKGATTSQSIKTNETSAANESSVNESK